MGEALADRSSFVAPAARCRSHLSHLQGTAGRLNRACVGPRVAPTLGHPPAGGSGAGFVVLLILLTFAQVEAASLYRCTDPSGASVLTDSPAQLDRCEVVEANSGVIPEPPARSPSDPPALAPAAPPDDDAQSTEFPGAPLQEASRSAGAGRVRVPVQRVGHLLIVSTKLNGTLDARLILDTGASHTILSREVSDNLDLLSNHPTATVTLKTAGGPVEAEVVRMSSIRVSEAEVRNSLVAVYDLPDAPPGVDGLLGLTFLKEFEMTLDAGNGVLFLRKPR